MTVTAPAAQFATDKQVAFVRKLLAEKNLAMIPGLAAQIQAGLDDGLTKQAASAAIDSLLALPKAPLAHDDGNAVGEGYYFRHEGEDEADQTFYRVVAAKTTGNLYAKRWSYADKGWVYAPGAMALLAGARRLTVEQAAEAGRLCGVCVVCGRELTDPDSVAAGIGPVCAARL